jgi:type I restriction enzyme R subunit
MDVLSSILQALDEQWGNIPWTDADRIGQVIAVDLPAGVGADRAYQNARRNSDKQNARIEHDLALERVMLALLADHMELYKQYSDNDSFRQWVADTVFERTYKAA